MLNLSAIRLKVCGLRDNIEEVVALGPDFVGFIFYPKSPRYVGDMAVERLSSIPGNIQKVGVFVNDTTENICEKVKKYTLDLVQLHGDETAAYCKLLKSKDIRIIKVFPGNDLPSLAHLKAYAPHIEYYLFDNRGASYGGTGQKFDWTLLKSLTLERPVLLSGGLDLDNISKLQDDGINVYAIDVNSKFEKAPGLKDIALLEELMIKMSGCD